MTLTILARATALFFLVFFFIVSDKARNDVQSAALRAPGSHSVPDTGVTTHPAHLA